MRTLLNRLADKRALKRRMVGRRYLYEPMIDRDSWLREQAGSLIDRHCHGRLAPLVAAFTESEQLDADDRRQLLELLERLR